MEENQFGVSLSPLEIDVSRETYDQLRTYEQLVVKWQKAKNLIAPSTIDQIWNRHILDSAQLAKHMTTDVANGRSKPILLDIGSGAGFPGLVLSTMGLCHSHMVEANGRKSSFMSMVSRTIELDATIHNERIESLDFFPVDIITSRACANLSQLLDWSYGFCHENTVLYFLKGEQAEEELTKASQAWTMQIKRHKSLTNPKAIIFEIRALKRISS